MHGGCFHRVNHGGDVWCGAWEEGKLDASLAGRWISDIQLAKDLYVVR